MGRFFSSENGIKKSQIQGAGECVTCHPGHCWNTPNFTTNFQVSLKNRDIWGSKPQKKFKSFKGTNRKTFQNFQSKIAVQIAMWKTFQNFQRKIAVQIAMWKTFQNFQSKIALQIAMWKTTGLDHQISRIFKTTWKIVVKFGVY